MKRFKNFLTTTLIGGVLVLLPIAILVFVVNWAIGVIANLIEPITDFLVNNVELLNSSAQLKERLAALSAFLIIVVFSFLVGLFVRTRVGKSVFRYFENLLLERIPFYKTIRDTVQQLLGNRQRPFSKVGLVDLFNTDTKMTAFVTDEYENGYTVFVPTGPNPTSGQIFHIPKHKLVLLETDVESAMKTIISCGAGSEEIVGAYSE